MEGKTLPFTFTSLQGVIENYPTPFHIYDEAAILRNANRLNRAFDWCPGFREYFAVKALPNPAIMQLLHSCGFGMDCSSLAELKLCELIGIRGEAIMFTSNDTSPAEFEKAAELGAIINLDDLSHLPYLENLIELPELLSFRYNPGNLRTGNNFIGHPEEAKYGLTREQLFDAYTRASANGVKRFGLHTMVASNELDSEFFVDTANMLFSLVADLRSQLGIQLEFVNMGGGIGIPYRPEEKPVNLEKLSRDIKESYQTHIKGRGLGDVKLYMENGRMITGPYGYLVSTVRHIKDTYKCYVGLDSSMADLMRPGMYGAYHHISIMGKEENPRDHVYDITGSLCENNDKFAIDRKLPEIEIGDIVVIHDTGAHGHAMGFNYNGKLRSAELLMHPDGSVDLIRRAETLDDLFATLKLPERVH